MLRKGLSEYRPARRERGDTRQAGAGTLQVDGTARAKAPRRV